MKPSCFGKIATPIRNELPEKCFNCDYLDKCALFIVQERLRKYGRNNPSVFEGNVMIPYPLTGAKRKRRLWV